MLAALACGQSPVFVRKTKYLNGARAVVTHTIDDSTRFVPDCVDAMDKYGIKATIFVSTEREPISTLWPRLERAIADGHEIGSHSRRHQCKWPDDETFCAAAYSDSEIAGSRDDILAHTRQPYVWSWCYPCGNCAGLGFVQQRLAAAGYLVARNYPDEARDGHLVPNLNDWAANPYNAAYTQVAQKKGGIALSGNTDVARLNAKFDEVYAQGGIYNLMSHPQWLDYGPDAFYERHLAHIARRADIWYVPMGPLYAYRTLRDRTEVRRLKGPIRYAVSANLDPKTYNGSVTLVFLAPSTLRPVASGTPLPERSDGMTDRWTDQYYRREGKTLFVTVRPNTILEFRPLTN
ncbi:MAG: polysaccharide deacetylase family protein [Acidobacteria bacterium]|nr:polysaccharide deacetylase family protein [Acidobacteriota bacterium]